MLSICIPVFNFDVSSLVEELSKQGSALSVPYEIIIIDDCSAAQYILANERVCSQFNYIRLSENIGRSKIRNQFIPNARYEYLLFLDCDSLIVSEQFLNEYIHAILSDTNSGVFCGGRVYERERPSRQKFLRWKYGTCRESQDIETRKKNTYKSFMTNNFLVRKSVLEKIKFNESLMEYGHEDTLFGFDLKKNNIPIAHLDNPVLNGDVEDNEEYLQKTEKGIQNLNRILKNIESREDFAKEVAILNFYNHINKIHLTGIVAFIFYFVRKPIRFLLSKGFVNLSLFDFYKLGMLLRINKTK